MREWTERHIRELVRNFSGGGGSGSVLVDALLLRLWVYRCSQEPITTLGGGTITFTIVKITTGGTLLADGKTLVRVDFTGCNWSRDYFIADPVSTMSANITPNTIPAGSILESAIASMFYGNTMSGRYWTSLATYQTDAIYCDQVQTDVRASFSYVNAWNDAKRTHYSADPVVGQMIFNNVPDGTNTVSIFYLI